MGLPRIEPPRRRVELPDGTTVEVRGMRQRDVLAINDLPEGPGRTSEVEIHTLACGTDTPPDEARAWYESVPSTFVAPLVKAIADLSGLGDAGKGSGED